MGLFDHLRGGTDNAITLSVPSGELAPGTEVTVRFDVTGELDARARAVRIGLQGTGVYKAKVERSYADGDGGRNLSTTEEWQSYTLHDDEREFPARTGPGEATFTVPQNAPPSSADAVTWEVTARIDREHGMDKTVRQEVVVRLGADSVPTSRSPQQQDDGLTLDSVPVAVRAGDTLSGQLTVAVDKDVKATGLQIRLYRKVTYTAAPMIDFSVYAGNTLQFFLFPGSGQIRTEAKVAEIELAGKREFSAGSTEQVPFSIQVPASAGPTTAHQFARVEWRVEAVIARRMRGDLTVDTPLAVY